MKDKELAAKFAKEKILPRLAPAFYPYTFFMVDQFYISKASAWSFGGQNGDKRRQKSVL